LFQKYGRKDTGVERSTRNRQESVPHRLLQKHGRKGKGVERTRKSRKENIEAELQKCKLRQILTWILAKILDSAGGMVLSNMP
jgi:hypothetical protein